MKCSEQKGFLFFLFLFLLLVFFSAAAILDTRPISQKILLQFTKTHPSLFNSVTESVLQGPASLTSPGNLLETPIPGPCLGPTESESLGTEPRNLLLTSMGSSCTLKFEKQCSKHKSLSFLLGKKKEEKK